MTRFAEFMARRKAWQVFIALVAPMVVSQFYFVAAVPAPSDIGQPFPSTMGLDQLFRRMMILAFLMILLFFSWLTSIGWVSNSRIDVGLRPGMRWYFGAAIYAAAYIVFAARVFPASFATGSNLPSIVVVTHLLAMVAIFYVLGFSAKNLIMAETKSPVTFFDYSGPFFLMWFFPVGVWFVQPRVNRLVAAK